MEALIKRAQSKALTDVDVRRITENECRIVEYNDLDQFATVWELLEPHGAAIVLVTSSPHDGHFCAVVAVDKSTVEWFDPYGIGIHGALHFSGNRRGPGISSVDRPCFDELVERTRGLRRVISNNTKFQSSGSTNNVCGRWSALRCVMRKYPLATFIKLFANQKNSPDFLVTALTLPLS